MMNRGEEEAWVQMNVVPRSTGNTNSGTRELTLKCKFLSATLNPRGFKVALKNLHFRVNSLVPLFVFPVLRGTTFIPSYKLTKCAPFA